MKSISKQMLKRTCFQRRCFGRLQRQMEQAEQIQKQDYQPQTVGIYSLPLDAVQKKEAELLQKFPHAEERIFQITRPHLYQEQKTPSQVDQRIKEVKSISFQEQSQLRRKILQEKGMDSDADASDYSEGTLETRTSQEKLESNKKIFRYLKVQNKNITLPDKEDPDQLTVFIELDDVAFFTFLCDENVGYLANPGLKDPEHELFLQEHNMPILFYERDYMADFFKYLRDSDFEVILYTSGLPEYTKLVKGLIDKDDTMFGQTLTQEACHLFDKPDEDILVYIKDIARFHNRRLERSVLIDSKPLSFIMAPDNGILVPAYKAEIPESAGKDDSLQLLMDHLDALKDLDDVRPYLRENFMIRQSLKFSKLI